MVTDIPQEDNGMPIGGTIEHGLEIGRAGRQDHFVGLQLKAVTGQCDIDKGLVMQEVLKNAQQVMLVVVPPQTVLLRHLGGHGDRIWAF